MDALSVYNDRHIKPKTRAFCEKICTIVPVLDVLEYDVNVTLLHLFLLILYLFKGKKYYFQV